jgi:parallel beta-helix repeat protein
VAAIRKAFPAVALILALLFSVIVGTQFVNVASANFFPEPTPQGIRIESDGSVNGTDRIHRDGNTYTLTDNIYDTIIVLRDSIVIDGAGYILQGNGNSTGIFLQDRNRVTVKNMEIRNFYCGIWLTWGDITKGSRNNNVSGNTITGNTFGITLGMETGNNFVYDNLIINNSYGIYIVHSPGNVLKNNHLKNNQYNLWIYVETSVPTSNFVNDIDDSNTIDDKPIYYWVNQHNKTVPSDAGYVALVKCTGITVQNLNLANNGQGVLLVSASNSLITKNRMTDNDYGIVVYGPYVPCVNNTITENEIVGNTKDGIYIWGNIASNITKNYIANNKLNGINAFDFTGGGIVGNNVTSHVEAGIKLWGDTLTDAVGNYVADNGVGIHLESSENRIISNIIIENNGFGMYLGSEIIHGGSTNNIIHHNSFINNHVEKAETTYINPVITYIKPEVEGLQVFVPAFLEWRVNNVWDDGEEGNYWSDYVTRYPNATEVEGLGIGNTPFYIDEKNIDRYPLLKPIAIPEVPSPSPPPSPSPTPTLTPSNPELFPTTLVVTASGVSVAIVGVGLFVYFKKHRK